MTGVAHYANHGEPVDRRVGQVVEGDPLSDRIILGPVAIDHLLVHDHDSGYVGPVLGPELATFEKRRAQSRQEIGSDDALVSPRTGRPLGWLIALDVEAPR